MVVLGGDMIFLSHLAMFMRPHDYQAIVRASFGPSDSTYRDDREANPNTRLYTFAPRKFVLPELFPGPNGEPPVLKSFVGSLFRNHFEQPPAHPEESVEIASDVVVQVIDVVHQHKFDPGAQPLEPLRYILFGKGEERLMEHRINKAPDFAHDLAVHVQGHAFSDDQLRHGVDVTVIGRPNNHRNKIQEGEKVPAIARLDGQELPIEIDATVELYFETDDLKDAM
jgi:hypothetical protein